MENTISTPAQSITIKTTVNAPVQKVWQYWTTPADVIAWNSASDDWHTTRAENDLRKDGRFVSRMEAKDGSMGFDFGGKYTEVKEYEVISYVMDDNRKVDVTFKQNGNQTEVTETFDAEQTNSIELQRNGWQAILDNFKKYVEEKVK